MGSVRFFILPTVSFFPVFLSKAEHKKTAASRLNRRHPFPRILHVRCVYIFFYYCDLFSIY